MSFAGDLQHLPIVDVIQLLHSTRKSGTLHLKSLKGESQLVFSDGYIVSANHANSSVRIGKILVDMKFATEADVELALDEQRKAGTGRKPLIATLIEGGKLKKEEAFRGLENLIEMTIVEVLTWTNGTFSLDVEKIYVSDEYRYLPETLQHDFFLNTQSVLMDALRIYDEKMRDGTLTEETFPSIEGTLDEIFGVTPGAEISVEDLGLADIDTVAKKIPDVFSGLRDEAPEEILRRKVGEELRDMPVEGQERLLSFLAGYSAKQGNVEGHTLQAAATQALIMLSRDRFLTHAVTEVCRQPGYFVFTTDDEVNLDPIIDQSLAKSLIPILVIDSPENAEGSFSVDRISALQQQKLGKYPQIRILQLISRNDYRFPLQSLRAGVRAVMPRPNKEERDTFAENAIEFLETFRSYLDKSFFGSKQLTMNRFRKCFVELDSLIDAPEISFTVLKVVSEMFERSLTLVVGKSELIAERGFGIKADKSAGATPPLRFRIPREEPSVFRDVIENNRLLFGECNDDILKKYLFGEIGAPAAPTILVLPITSHGKVVALIYGDFGKELPSAVQSDLLEILARHAGLVLDNASYRKKFVKPHHSA
ncbi:MAG: DUF4388 domain-containing protein [Geobacter sp.]|nr:DUF4388 domain-containing protein [Geobacter sp.]